MRYDDNLIDRFIEELEKVPNIRHVCSKLGIHHSTFYRWEAAYEVFRNKVYFALHKGRNLMNDSAEAVIIKGIQEGHFGPAKYWLSHNNLRYMEHNQAIYQASVIKRQIKEITDPEKKLDDSDFENWFAPLYKHERDYGFDDLQGTLFPFINIFCGKDKEMVKVFYASYDKWKKELESEKEDEEFLQKKMGMFEDVNPSPQ